MRIHELVPKTHWGAYPVSDDYRPAFIVVHGAGRRRCGISGWERLGRSVCRLSLFANFQIAGLVAFILIEGKVIARVLNGRRCAIGGRLFNRSAETFGPK